MKKISLILGLLIPIFLNAQNLLIKGTVSDTSTALHVKNAVVSFLKQSDSTLAGFTRTNDKGGFEKVLSPDAYIVLITSPNYADFVITLNGLPDAVIDLGDVGLISRAKLLEEIIVSQQSIRIKGDTTEYMADSFKVKPNATVEDLLKQLPGIQVDKSGSITAQGQRVQKILVDGDEFFSDDPTIATRNLRADAIRKVQVFDKKSDEASFTGIDDGKQEKAINLELKDEAKNGYFGKLAIAGLDRYYNLQALINAFKEKRKLAAFAIGSSTDQTGLDWQSAGNYGFDSGTELSEETGGITVSSNTSEGIGTGNFAGGGLPKSIKGGIHYSNKWNEDRTTVASNYLFNNLKVKNRTRSLTQNILDNSVYFTGANADTHSDKTRNDLSGIIGIEIDSTSSFKVNLNGNIESGRFSNDYQAENLDEGGQLINSSIRSTQTTVNSGSEGINAIYSKRFSRPGQTLSISFSQGYNKLTSSGSLLNKSIFFDLSNGQSDKKDTVDQHKTSNNTNATYAAAATFTQPLSDVSFLVLSYTFTNSNAKSTLLTYDAGVPHDYQILNDSLSSNFKYVYYIHNAGLNYRYSKSKINASVGGSITTTEFRLEDFFMANTTHRSYTNVYPRADFNYRFSPYRSIRVNYDGSSVEPTMDQMQPIINNLDPMNLFVGNPNLKQEFVHSAEVFFTDIKFPSERYTLAGGGITLTNNQINESYFLDSLGRRISQYANTNGNYKVRLFTMVNLKFPGSDVRFGIGPLAQLYRYSNLVNLKSSITNATNLRLRITLQGAIGGKMNFNFAAMPGYNLLRSNISRVSGQDYWDANIIASTSYQLPGKFEAGSDVVADFRQKITSFDRNNNIISWNAYIEKRFLKKESLALRASIFDILDQNKGYYRYQLATGLQEQHYLTLGQYGLISLTYNFVNRNGKGPANLGGGFTF